MERNRNSRRRRRRRIRFLGRRVDLRRLVPFVVFLAIFVVSASMLISYGVQSVRRKGENADLARDYEAAFVSDLPQQTAPAPVQTVVVTAVPEPAATPAPQLLDKYHDFSGETPAKARSLYNQNNDLVGWLSIRGVVSLPVVQRDNEFYLDHGFNGKKSSGGALFLDQYHPMAEQTQHFLIHGHNMHDSSMFGIVSTYYKPDMVKNHGFANFSTMHAPEDYVIYAVLRVPPDVNDAAYLPYVGTANFRTEEDFYRFAGEIQARSMFDIGIDVLPSDALLSLSTCIDDDRLLVCFRRMRAGETKEDLQYILNQARKR